MTIVIRKVSMVVVGGVFGSRLGPDMQVYMALFLVVMFIVVHLAAKPFEELTHLHKVLHWLELGALLICWGTLYSGMLFWLGTTAGRLGPGFLTLVSFSIIFGNVLFTISLVVVFVRAVHRESKKDGEHSEEALRRLIRVRSGVETASGQRVKVSPKRSQNQLMERVAGSSSMVDKLPPQSVAQSNKWTAISKFKLGQAMEESRRSGRTIMRGDTRKIALGVQKKSLATSTARKKQLHRRRSEASSRLQQRLNMRSARQVGGIQNA
jgi:membrane protein implicated in regulation of membrane protease activity